MEVLQLAERIRELNTDDRMRLLQEILKDAKAIRWQNTAKLIVLAMLLSR